MSIDLKPTSQQQSRGTWRQWSKLARVRIGFVLMLIVASFAFLVWWPRRTVVAVLLMGGDVYDSQADARVASLQSQLPADVWLFVKPWSETLAYWLATDAGAHQVFVVDAPSAKCRFKLLQRFPRLTRVALHASQVGPALDELAGIKTLTDVQVYGLTATDRLGELSRLPHIEKVEVYRGCPRTGGGWNGLRDMPHLRTLVIDHPASFDALNEVGQIASLEVLLLKHGVRKEDDLRLLCGNHSLTVFSAQLASGIGATGLKHVAQISSLERLYLPNFTATDDEFQVLARLHNLKHLTITSTNVTPDGMERLKRALPQCQFDVP